MKKDLAKLFRPEVIKREAYRLKPYPKVIKLNQNELPYDFSPKLKQDFIRRIKKTAFQRYPNVQPDRLAKKLASSLKVSPEQILFSNGSNVLIQNIILSAAVKGKVLSLEPGFSLFESETQLLGNRYLSVQLASPRFEFPLEKILKTIKKERPQVVFIANPHAPTGTLFPKEKIIRVVANARCLVVVDEAYFQFSKATVLPQIKKYPNLIVLRTFSKGFGLGGARVGYMVARKEVTQQIKKVILPYCLPILSEEAALVVLSHQKYYQKIIGEVITERERVFRALQKMKNLECYPSHTNFILFRVRDAQRCFRFLLKKKILIRDMSDKKGLEGCLRVTIGRKSENNAFLKALKQYTVPSRRGRGDRSVL